MPESANAIAGVDEAGRGPLAGPVCAAAVILGTMPTDNLIDSKKLSPAQRDRIAALIRRSALAWHIGWASVAEIDTHNILGASLLAMRRAVSGLSLTPSLVLVDGNRDPHFGLTTQCIVGGDARVAAIAAASIVAKVARDRYMRLLDRAYPGYGFMRHKGYPTADHIARLNRLGPTAVHRHSFGPVARCLANANGSRTD